MKTHPTPAILKGFLNRLLSTKKMGRTVGGSSSKRKVPRIFSKHIGTRAYRKAWEGMSSKAGGPESLFMWLPIAAAEKGLGKEPVRKALWKYMHSPAMMADMAAGGVLEKIPLIGKKLFRVKESIPWGKNLYMNVERSSALGPIVKMRSVATPIIVGVGLEKGLKHISKSREDPLRKEASDMSPNLREKVASTMLQLHRENKEHTKRAHALKLLYKQAESGCEQLPQSYSELEEKLAALINQDLVVLEKALELTGGSQKLGELGSVEASSTSQNATEQFQAAIISNEW